MLRPPLQNPLICHQIMYFAEKLNNIKSDKLSYVILLLINIMAVS